MVHHPPHRRDSCCRNHCVAPDNADLRGNGRRLDRLEQAKQRNCRRSNACRGSDSTLQTQIQVITSRPVAEETAKRLQLNVPPEAIQGRVSAQVLGQTSIIRVRARDASASLARDIANGVSATYIDLRRKSALDSFAQQANDIQKKVDEATAELQQRDAELSDAISRARGEKTSDTGSQALVATLTNRREQAAAVQSFWKTALDKLQIQSNLQTSSAEAVAPATLPTAPVEPKLSRKVIFALTIGVLLGAGIAFLVEYLDDSLRSKQDAEKAFGAPILGMIPRAILERPP